MHITFVTPEYPDEQKPEGGLGNYIRKVSLELIQCGHSVTIFCLASSSYSKKDNGIHINFIKCFKWHWRLHRVKALHPWLELHEQIHNAKIIKKAVLSWNKKHKIDILQTPSYKAPGIFLCHNHIFPVVCRCSSYQPLLRSANGIRQSFTDAISDWLETRQVICADSAFAPSEFIAGTYKHYEAYNPLVIRTPIHATTVELEPSIYYQLLAGKKYLLYFGALNGIKGIDILLQAIPSVLSENPELTMVLIGRNDVLPCGIRAVNVIESDLAKYYREQRIIYISSLPKSQLYPFIDNALGVVIPSRVDNYPNACLEAFSRGVPVIGTMNSSLDEIIVDGQTGFLAENCNVKSLSETLHRFLDQTANERNQMVNNIFKRVHEMQKEDHIGRLLNHYEEVINMFAAK